MSQKEKILDLLGIPAWYKAGYTGKGIKILSVERVSRQKKFPNVIAVDGYGNDEEYNKGDR